MRISRLRSIFSRDWRTVAVASRSTMFVGAIYPLHGVATREPVRLHYRILLQETSGGRRRWRIECQHEGVRTSMLSDDPLLQNVRKWRRGGDRPIQFIDVERES